MFLSWKRNTNQKSLACGYTRLLRAYFARIKASITAGFPRGTSGQKRQAHSAYRCGRGRGAAGGSPERTTDVARRRKAG